MKSTAVEVPLRFVRGTGAATVRAAPDGGAALTDRPVIGLSRDQRAVARYRLE